jgi:NAD(P)-dependent dehydrogenase (short-subunit alcohol dehydrogenase family)
MRLEGKKALVTGAGSHGIGRAIALAFAREGADVAIHYHSRPEVAASVVAEIEGLGRRALSLPADLSEAETCRQVVRAANERLGGLDVIVTAAAAIYRKPILEITDAEWDHMMALNLRGTFACAAEAARIMRAAGTRGRIIVLGSVVQQLALAGQVAYGTTKGGVAQLARGMALELAPDGITVNVLAPGATLTDFNREYLADAAVRQRRIDAIPIGRLGAPEDMAEAALYLASPGAAYVTGITIFVDGGLMLP